MPGFYSGPPVGYAAVEAEGSEAVPLPRGGVFARGFGEGLSANLGPRLIREAGREAATTGVIGVNEFTGEPITIPPEPAVDADALESEFGIAGHLKFTSPMPRSVAQDLHDQKMEQLKREADIARAEPSVLNTPNRFTANLLAGFLDPVNLAVGMVPIAGETAWAARLVEGAGSALGRAGARAVIGGIEGGIGQAALEPLSYWLSTREHDDYTMADSLRNIALGTVMGGGFHAGIGAAIDRIAGTYRNPVARGLDEAGPGVREGMLNGALGQTIDGRPVDVSTVLDAADAIRVNRLLGEGGIAGDIERKMIAAGRPADEAAKTGVIVQSLFETHAERFGGRLGTAEEIYLREGPDILRGWAAGEQAGGAPPAGRVAETTTAETRAQIDALDSQIKALEVARDTPGTTAAERTAHNAQIAGLQDQRIALGAVAAPEVIGREEFLRDHTDAEGRTDLGAASDALAGRVQTALDAGQPVTLYADGTPVPIQSVERGQMVDQQGNRWGTLAIATDNTGGNRVEIGGTAPPADTRAWFDPAVQAERKAAEQAAAAQRQLLQEAAPGTEAAATGETAPAPTPEEARAARGPAPRIERTPPASRAAAPDIERAPAAGEPDGPVAADAAADITKQAEQLEAMRRPAAEGAESRPAAVVEAEADAQAHASALERASLCVAGGYV